MTVALAVAFLTNGGPRALGWLGLAAGVAASLATASRTALVVLGALAVVFLLTNVRIPGTFVRVLAAAGLIGIAMLASVAGLSGGISEWSAWRSTVQLEGRRYCDTSPAGDPGADCAVLLAMRDILAGEVALNWSNAVPVDRWRGVSVDGPEGRITGLNLAGLGLNGRIPTDLGRLDRLVSLLLQRNRLTGHIPPELGDLASLEILNLNYNHLTGGIPPELAKLDRLNKLRLVGNRLTGPVPAALEELDLSALSLRGNDFDSVPLELTDVAAHDLAGAWLCLPLPPTSPALFDDCTVLLAVKETLAGDASLNWHAEIPVGSWEGVTVGGPRGRVAELVLYRKGLNGRIPPELGRLDGLIDLNLAANHLTGTIPRELVQLSKLESLWLRENRLTGPVPPELLEIPAHDLGALLFCAPESRLGPSLLNDCTVLLAVQGALAGEAELNWNLTRPISQWVGVTLGGMPTRVTGLSLSKGLTGRIPRRSANWMASST